MFGKEVEQSIPNSQKIDLPTIEDSVGNVDGISSLPEIEDFSDEVGGMAELPEIEDFSDEVDGIAELPEIEDFSDEVGEIAELPEIEDFSDEVEGIAALPESEEFSEEIDWKNNLPEIEDFSGEANEIVALPKMEDFYEEKSTGINELQIEEMLEEGMENFDVTELEKMYDEKLKGNYERGEDKNGSKVYSSLEEMKDGMNASYKEIKENKPMNSPNLAKWFEKGGKIEIQIKDGKEIWVYVNAEGVKVPYVDGYPVFPPETKHPYIEDINIGYFRGERPKDKEEYLKILEEEYGLTEIPEGYALHHDSENGVLQLVKEEYHKEFTHAGGHSKYKEDVDNPNS